MKLFNRLTNAPYIWCGFAMLACGTDTAIDNQADDLPAVISTVPSYVIYQDGFEKPGFTHKGYEDTNTRGTKSKDYLGWLFSINGLPRIDPLEGTQYFEGYLNKVVRTDQKARLGNYAAKFYIPRDGSADYRSEVREARFQETFGVERWFRFSIYVEENWPLTKTGSILAQWHAGPDSGSERSRPPLVVKIDDGKWRVKTYWDEDIHTTTEASEASLKDKNKEWDIAAFEAGKWTDWIVHIKWSYEENANNGILEIWKDWIKAVDYFGPNTFKESNSPYFKMGTYTSSWRDANFKNLDLNNNEISISHIQVYHDAFMVADETATYEDMVLE